MIAWVRLAASMALAWTTIGCTFAPIASRGKSPLSPFKPGLETAALEVVFLRHQYELSALNEELWTQIDETPIEADVRQALAQNGLRVGVIAGPLPTALETALAGEKQPIGEARSEAHAPVAPPVEMNPLVRRRSLHALPGQRAELLTSGIYERLPLLIRDGEAHGNYYAKAQCVLAVNATPLGDHRVRLQLVPEVQFGDPRHEVRGEDGMFRFDSSRPKIAFEKMAVNVVLSPGQTLAVGTRPELDGSMGHYFFTEPQAGQIQQKLVLLRFEGTRYDNLLMTDGDGGR